MKDFMIVSSGDLAMRTGFKMNVGCSSNEGSAAKKRKKAQNLLEWDLAPFALLCG